MRPDPGDSKPSVLQYRTADAPPAGRSAVRLSACSILCALVPIVGFSARNGPLFLLGLPLSFIGITLGIAAIVVSARTGTLSVSALLATSVNACSVTYFVWLFFVRGLC